MLGERNQTQIKKEALLLGRRTAGREQEDVFGERHATHEILGEISATHRDPLARRGGDRGSGGPRFADQHGVPFGVRSLRFPRAANGCKTIVGQYQRRRRCQTPP